MIYLTGKGGQLATELEQLLPEAKAFSRKEWDITDIEQGRSIIKDATPAFIINCAAYNAVDKAEEDPTQADLVNHKGPEVLATLCKEFDIFLVHVSTDFVFGEKSQTGEPLKITDAPDPESNYARSKLNGEKAVQEILSESQYSIIRTSWVYSSYGANFVKTILRLASDPNREELTIISDQIGRPTRAYSLALFIKNLITLQEKNQLTSSFFQFSNTGQASWYDFAKEIVALAYKQGLLDRQIPIKPIPTEAYPLPAKRPRYSVMDLSSSLAIYPDIPSWKKDLEEELKIFASS